MMPEHEMLKKNIDLAFEVIRQVVSSPELATEVDGLAADGALVLFDPEDDRLATANDALAQRIEARGSPIVRASLQRRLSLQPR